MAECFNEYFSNVGLKLSENIDTPLNSQLPLPTMNVKTIFIKPVTYKEIELIIKNLKIKKGGVDNISSKVLKAISIFI